MLGMREVGAAAIALALARVLQMLCRRRTVFRASSMLKLAQCVFWSVISSRYRQLICWHRMEAAILLPLSRW
jgi:hypothetical protein